MEKEFVPYEQALALKELGFDEPCLMKYRISNKILLSNDYVIRYVKIKDVIGAQLYQQVFRWFREKYSLFTQDFIDLDNKFTKNIVKVTENGQDFIYLNYHKTYEEAELECLKKLIEIVKNG